MTFFEATKRIENIILNSYEGGFFPEEKRDLDRCLAQISVASRFGGEAAVLLVEIRGYIRSLSSPQGMRKYNSQYQTVRSLLLTALDTLRSLEPKEDLPSTRQDIVVHSDDTTISHCATALNPNHR